MNSMRDYLSRARMASGLNIGLGVWLIAAPWVFDYSGRAAVVSSVFVGAVVGLLAAFRLAALRDTSALSIVNLCLGLFTVASPWVSGYATNSGGTTNSIIVGIAVAALALRSALSTLIEGRQ